MLQEFLFEDDGLVLPDVGYWSEVKHEKLSYYSEMFSTAMKGKWDCRIYLDLFAAAGKARVRDTREIIPGSPLLALTVPFPFDRYVFCEQNPGYSEALRTRVQRYFPDANVTYVEKDSNASIDEVLRALPKFSANNRGLTLCFVDPYSASQLQFRTLQVIAENLYVDFLVLIPTFMDIHRNEGPYTKADCEIVDRFLGDPDWRNKWPDPSWPNREFGPFVAAEFCQRMQRMGFRGGLSEMELIRMTKDKNQKLYHLAFFSKEELAIRFWKDTRRNTNAQMSLLD